MIQIRFQTDFLTERGILDRNQFAKYYDVFQEVARDSSFIGRSIIDGWHIYDTETLFKSTGNNIGKLIEVHKE